MIDKIPKQSYLRINDIEFDTPPDSITIVKRDFNNQIPTLRTQQSTVIKSGRRAITYIIDLTFASGSMGKTGSQIGLMGWVNKQVAPLLIQMRKCPFVSIENEKIRLELFGDTPQSIVPNMAAVIKDITFGTQARQAGILTVSITCESFNHHPYSPDFSFKDITPGGAVQSSPVPGEPYKKFYSSGTTAGGRFVNELLTDQGRGMRLIYKRYYELSYEIENPEQVVSNLAERTASEREDILQQLSASVTPMSQKLQLLKAEGWYHDNLPQINPESSDTKLIYRYEIFDIPDSIKLSSDALIIESATASLEARVPSIPLQAHAIPTHQFLGCTDAKIAFQIFANAELIDNTPVGTSRELGRLNAIIEAVNDNALKYHRASLNDGIFISHPIAKLCKYKQYLSQEQPKLIAYNGNTQGMEDFDPNDFLLCIVEDSSSSTVPSLPYCSRFNLTVVENFRNISSDNRQRRDGGANTTYQAGLSMIRTLVKRFGIIRDGEKFRTSDQPLAMSMEEQAIAYRLVDACNANLSLLGGRYTFDSDILPTGEKKNAGTKVFFKDYQSVDEILSDKAVMEMSSREIKARLGTAVDEDEDYSGLLTGSTANTIVDDLINLASRAETEMFSDYTIHMKPFVDYNLIPVTSCYPDMMLPEGVSQPDFAWYNLSDELNTPEYLAKLGDGVFADRALIGEASAKSSAGGELPGHLKEFNFQPAKWVPSPAVNPAGTGAAKEGLSFSQNPLDPEQQRVVSHLALQRMQENTYTMRRAMPTFKLFIKEELPIYPTSVHELENPGAWRNFSDFYDLSSVIDIRIAKDKNNPVDLLVIRMTNAVVDIYASTYKDKRSLDDLTVVDKAKRSSQTPDQLKKIRAGKLDPLDGVMIKEGSRVELRLGYSDNPNDLSVEFVGRIMSTSGSDIVEIVCQGDGVELITELKGVGVEIKSVPNTETSAIITDLISDSPEVFSLGATGAVTALGELNFLWNGFGGRIATENIFAPTLFNSWDQLGTKTIQYASWGAAIGTLIPIGITTFVGFKIGLAAGALSDLYTLGKTWLKGSPFVVYEQTIWDVLQELTLRHPGTICAVVPYGNRSTIFFGYPEQLYFYREPTYAEGVRYRHSNKGKLNVAAPTRRDILNSQGSPVLSFFGETSMSNEDLKKTFSAKQYAGSGVSTSALKPFMSYHIITSEHDIIMNDMIVTSDNVSNAVTVMYPKTTDEANYDGSKGFSAYEKTDSFQADDDIIKQYIRSQTMVFHNARTDAAPDLPNRYGTQSLVNSLKEVYSGKISILGRPGIKPHDTVFIEDTYNGIHGPVSVGSVTQVFSYNTGWVTEIHPNMIVGVSGTTTLDQVEAMKYAAKKIAMRNIEIYYMGKQLNSADQNDLNISALSRTVKGVDVRIRRAGSSTYLAGVTALTGYAAKAAFEKGKVDAAKAVLAGKVVKSPWMAAGTKVVKFAVIGLIVDYAATRYISWSKYRQPVNILPVHRKGRAWYAAMHGFKNNAEMEAASKYLGEKYTEVKRMADQVLLKLRGSN